MSNVCCPIGIAACLKEAANHIESKGEWEPQNTKQKQFFNFYFKTLIQDLDKAQSVIEYKASKSAKELNKFLSDNGFNIELDEFASDEFGTASVLNQFVEWTKKGKRRKIEYKSVIYDAFKLSKGIEIRQCGKAPVTKIITKNEDTVFIAPATRELSGFPLYTYAIDMKFEFLASRMEAPYEGIVIPMVDLDQKVDISWLHDLKIYDKHQDPWVIADSEQEARFRMNETGARAEVATAVTMLRASASSHGPLIINDPFFLWLYKKDCTYPTAVFYIDENDWSDPKTLK